MTHPDGVYCKVDIAKPPPGRIMLNPGPGGHNADKDKQHRTGSDFSHLLTLPDGFSDEAYHLLWIKRFVEIGNCTSH